MRILAEFASLNFVRNFRTILDAVETADVVNFYVDAKRSLNTLQQILNDSVLYGATPKNDEKIRRYVLRALRQIKKNM